MITVQQFKTFFRRDFPYLPVYDASKAYWTNDEVYYSSNEQFYISLIDNNTTSIADTTAWQRIQDDIDNYIIDQDITSVIEQTEIIIPDNIEIPDNVYTLLQYYLAAHLLVDSIRTSNAGLTSQLTGITTGKSIGSVSQQYGIPQQLLNSELYSFYITSQYGLKYLVLIMPYLNGNISCVKGATTP